MESMDLVSVLGALGLGTIGLVWRIRSGRVQLNVEIDRERSRFVTVEVRRNVAGDTVSEIRTGISLLVSISNVSARPNTITEIKVEEPALLDALPNNASFVTDVRVRPHRLYSKSMTEEEVTNWDIPGGWRTPHNLLPGGHHEAGLSYLLAGDPRPRETALPVKVTVSDSNRKRYRKAVCLRVGFESHAARANLRTRSMTEAA